MIAGIDLGTTFSCISVWKDGESVLVPNSEGEHLTPSVVSMADDKNKRILVGQAAKDRLLSHPHMSVACVKRYMGTSKIISIGGKEFLPEEISSFIIRSLVSDAEEFLGESIESVVITVPAYFQDAQRNATKNAGELAGIKVARIINEPTSASLAYSLHEKPDQQNILVFDLGGGTFDVSILEIFDGVVEVRSTAGDSRLGGEDFNEVLFNLFYNGLNDKEISMLSAEKGKLKNIIWKKIEDMKISLSGEQKADLVFKNDKLDFSWSISRQDFERNSEELLSKIRHPLEQAMRDASLRSSEIDEIVLVGGSTKIPMVRELVARMFGRLPRVSINADKVVGIGAGIVGAMHMRNEDLKEHVLTDINPFTLGIGVARELGNNKIEQGIFSPIIERGSLIPVSKVDKYETIVPGQERITVKIYQGESYKVSDNTYLGEVKVPVPRNLGKKEAVDIRFTYDINGILEVEAVVCSTGRTYQTVIEGNPGIYSKDQIKRRLKELEKLKIHPKEKRENIAMLARAERMYEEYIGFYRDYISGLIAAFKNALETQDIRKIDIERKKLKDSLDRIESNPFDEE